MIINAAQVTAINRYHKHVPTEVIAYLTELIGDLEPNPEDFIPNIHDGWRIEIIDARDIVTQVPDPAEYSYEYNEHIKCKDSIWTAALMLENNETSCTYVFEYKGQPGFEEHGL